MVDHALLVLKIGIAHALAVADDDVASGTRGKREGGVLHPDAAGATLDEVAKRKARETASEGVGKQTLPAEGQE